MKSILTVLMTVLALIPSSAQTLEVTVKNPCKTSRKTELVELDVKEVKASLSATADDGLYLTNEKGETIPFQITYDQKLIFPVKMEAGEKQHYLIGTCLQQVASADTISCGAVHPERQDDLAWENDLVAFRAYGPGTQKTDNHVYGYDIFAKRGTYEPMLDKMYKLFTDPELNRTIRRLYRKDKAEAKRLRESKSYHIDRGYGMDCYAVGPTLGAGAAALRVGEEIIYPWCYTSCEILDNGPLRFTVRLTYDIKGYEDKEPFTEIRTISLDAGSHLNKTQVRYDLPELKGKISSGIVIHDENGRKTVSPERDFMSYQDPTTGKENGELYLGHVFPEKFISAGIEESEDKGPDAANPIFGQLLSFNRYHPETGFTYWWGYGWNKNDIPDYDAWNDYLKSFSLQLRHRLKVKVKRIDSRPVQKKR